MIRIFRAWYINGLITLFAPLLSGCAGNALTGSASNSSNLSITVTSSQSSVTVGGQVILTASEAGKPAVGGSWFVTGGSANGTTNASGVFFAPTSLPSDPHVNVCYVLGSSQTCVEITIIPLDLVVTPSQPSVPAGGTVTFTASNNGSNASGGVWTVAGGAANGAITSGGIYKAPPVVPNPPTVTITYTFAGAVYYGSTTITPPPATFSVSPATLAGGPLTLTLSGTGFNAGESVLLNGQPMQTTIVSSTQIIAVGFLTPWSSGFANVELASNNGLSVIGSASIPIAPTAVSFDAAARFSTQAAFGPRPDIVQQIQQMGFDAFITQQFQQPALTFSYPTSTNGGHDYINAVTSGTSLLRARVAYALETFIVGQGEDCWQSSTFLETKLENDASGNFRQLLTDVATDVNIGSFLNLANNFASTNNLSPSVVYPQPNQNFARELMQLFSLGAELLNDDGSLQLDASGNPIPTYDQNTILGLTRALTGWTYPPIVNPSATVWGRDFSQPLVSVPVWHDEGAKELFGTVMIPAGQSAVEDQTAALNAIFNHPNVPPFVSKLLIQQLVTSNPSPAYIKRIASVFENDGTGVRGNMDAVVRAILEDPEARSGDTLPSPADGFLQSPLKFQAFLMSALQAGGSDDQVVQVAPALGENWWGSPTVFYFFSPSYMVPGTTINSPEFMLFNNVTALQRSQMLWGIIVSQQPGLTSDYKPNSWLFSNFKTVPAMVDALNHLLYHGQMSQAEQAAITNYCAQLDPTDTTLQLESAVFLAMNSDSYNVSH